VKESKEKRKKKRKKKGGGELKDNQTMIQSNTSNYLNLPPCTNPKKESTYLTHTQQKNTYQHFFALHNTEINAIKKKKIYKSL
jgi:hypothetical protein